MRILEIADLIRLLRSEITQAGGQKAWAKKKGLDRSHVNTILNGRRPLTKKIIQALSLRVVFVQQQKSARPRQSTRQSSLFADGDQRRDRAGGERDTPRSRRSKADEDHRSGQNR
jgi:hypothetical protein